MQTVLENPWVRAAGVLAAFVGVCLFAYALTPVLVPLFLALTVAYVLDPVVDFFEARKVPRIATIAGLALAGLVLALGMPLIVVPSVFHQASTLVASARGAYAFEEVDADRSGAIGLPELTSHARGFDRNDFVLIDADHNNAISKAEWDIAMSENGALAQRNTLLDRLLDYLPVNRLVSLLELDIAVAPGDTADVSDASGPVDARALLAEYIGKNVRDFTVQFVKTNASSLALFGQQAGMNIVGFFTTVGQRIVDFLLFLANFALFAIVAGYLLKDFDPLKASARTLIPPRYAPKTVSVLAKIDDQLRGFLRGQMTVCVCLGAMYTIGFLICGVPFAIV
ncbi:MAG: AI-2E family transporter, partial [Candidatus Hydrogenedentes bacterium]|nr:AI-2E family transporter [Candidatus Hydrogenedentota bacterium]